MFKFSLVLLALVSTSFGIECPPEGQYFFEHPFRCNKFIECNDGVEMEQDCFADLVFNPEVGFCDFSSNYPCEDKPEPTDPTPEEGPVGTCPEINGEFVDFLTDAVRCDVFYMCNWGVPIKGVCPSGLHFNRILWVCDYPYRAECPYEEVSM